MSQEGFSNPGTPPASSTLPQNPQIVAFEEFSTLNNKASQPGILDGEMFVCDGFMPLGRNNLRVLRGLGTAIYTVPGSPTHASGYIYFPSNPANNDTITLNSIVFTFVNDSSGWPNNETNYKINIQATTGATIALLVQALTTGATYLADFHVNQSNYYDGGGSTTDSLNIVYINPGTGGNAFGLAASAATVSGATLTGGTSPNGIISNFNFNNIGSTPLCMVCTSDGNLTQVNMDTLVATILPGSVATGSISFSISGNPANGDTITLNGVVFTFVNDGTGYPNNSSNYKIEIGGSLFATLFNLAAPAGGGDGALNHSSTYLANPALNVATYNLNDPTDDSVVITYLSAGTQGNSYTLAASAANPGRSGPTLTGGAATITGFDPDYSQWADQYIIIVAPQTNGYWIWDGTNLFTAGGLAPQIEIIDAGSGYTSAPTVVANGGSGTGATFTASVSNGSVVSVTVTNPGSGYLVGENVALTFTGGGSDNQAAATPTISADYGVSSVIINDGGHGYSSLVQVASSTSGASAQAQFAVTGQNGVITGVTVVNPGLGYTSVPTLTVTDLATSAVGTGAVLTAVLSGGQIASVALLTGYGGTGYTTPPTMTIVGDGVGAVLSATLSAGTIGSISVINGGYGYTEAVIQFDGGNNAAAAIAMLMPFGISGETVETYESRVWVGNGRNVYVSAPGSAFNFATSDGATAFQSTDSFLKINFTQFTQSNGFLYTFADSSLNYISGVQTSGNPPETTFSNLNVDPQIGTPWHSTVQPFGRNLVFANPIGVYVSYGGAVTKVSDPIDGIYTSVPSTNWPPGFEPSAAVMNIFGIRVYILTMPIIHPVTQTQVISHLMWDGKRWWTSPQEGVTNPFVATQLINSQLVGYETPDGVTIQPMFTQPTTDFTKYLYSKLWDNPGVFYTKMAQENFGVVNVNIYDDATAAMGQIFFNSNLHDGDSITLNGRQITFVTGAPVGYQIQIQGTTGGTIVQLVNSLNSGGPFDTDPLLTVATYSETGGSTTDFLTVTYKTTGTAGNAYTLQVNCQGRTNIPLATLTGGSDGAQIATTPITEHGLGTQTLFPINASQGPFVYGPIPTAQQGTLQGIALQTTASDIQVISASMINRIQQSNI